MNFLSALTAKELRGKRVLVRMNLDIADAEINSPRLNATRLTLQFLLDRGAHPIIISHRGRPNGADPKLSLRPLIDIVNKKLSLHYGNSIPIEWKENVRFDPREQKNNDTLAKELATRADLYVNDDFATSHRTAASLVAITKYLPSYAGLLLENEVAMLTKVMERPEHPLILIIGGVKIEDKIGVIENFKNKADFILMGSSYFGQSKLTSSQDVILPEDWVGENGQRLDIGPNTIATYTKIIATAKTVIWNGPVGMFEQAPYHEGSRKIAEAIIASGAFSVVGGGDTGQLLAKLGLADKFSFLSTGGGAMLEFLAGKRLPAIEALG